MVTKQTPELRSKSKVPAFPLTLGTSNNFNPLSKILSTILFSTYVAFECLKL